MTNPVFFATAADFGAWLAEHHDSVAAQWVGYFRKKSGKASITWEESVDEALCYGWIDGLRKSLDEERYVIRFTPRKPKSVWSGRNIDRVAVLTKEGRMRAPGLAAFAHHKEHSNSGYRTADHSDGLWTEMEAAFQANPDAWSFYTAQTQGYRKQTARWVTSGKREETRQRRLATLISDSAAGLKIKQLRNG